jgi:uncharacterized protein
VFAIRQIKAGERVLEYRGELTSWREAVRRHRRDGVDGHTSLFGLSDGCVIDGSRGGDSAPWLNQSCEELLIEYQLAFDNPLDEDLRRQYAYRCSSIACRRSMLADVARCADVVFHRDVLRPSLVVPAIRCSGGGFTIEQLLSFDLDDE